MQPVGKYPKATAIPDVHGSENLMRSTLKASKSNEVSPPIGIGGEVLTGQCAGLLTMRIGPEQGEGSLRMPRLIGGGRAGVAGVDWSLKLDLPTSRWIVAQACILTAVTHSRLVGPLLPLCFATATPEA